LIRDNLNLKKIDFCLKSRSRATTLINFLEDPFFKIIDLDFNEEIFKKYIKKLEFDKNLTILFINHILFESLNTNKLKSFEFANIYFCNTFSFNFKFLDKNTFIPCVFLNENQIDLIYFFISEIESEKNIIFGDFIKNNSSKEFKDSVLNSFKLLNSKKSFFIEGLKYNSNLELGGKSASLSFYLGFFSIENNKLYPNDLIFSSVLDDEGKTQNTMDLNKKKEFILNKNFKFFIVPSINYYENKNLSKDLKTLPSTDIKEAKKTLALASQKGFLKEYFKFILFPAEALSSYLYSVPVNILKAVLKKTEETSLVENIVFNETLFSGFIKNFIKSSNTDLEKALLIISLIENNFKIFSKSPFFDLLFLFSSSASLVFSRKGIPSQENKWIEISKKFINNAVKTRKGRNAFIWFTNHCLVNSNHDKYIFNPEIPITIKNFLNILEKRFHEECEFIPEAADDTIAALCGTIAQNYGFCGKDYIHKTKEFALKAIKYFGGETNLKNSKFRDDIKRQFNYLCFAYLDAGDFNQAEKYFLKYSNSSSISEAVNKEFDQWGHFLCASFLSRNKNIDIKNSIQYQKFYFDKYKNSHPENINKYHPSQLWFFNLGLIGLMLEKSDDSKNLLKKSLKICLDEVNGDSIRVMALLPLSELVLLEDLNSWADEVFETIKKSALKLSHSHFSILFTKKKTIEILKNIREDKEKFFPFSYR